LESFSARDIGRDVRGQRDYLYFLFSIFYFLFSIFYFDFLFFLFPFSFGIYRFKVFLSTLHHAPCDSEEWQLKDKKSKIENNKRF